MPLPDLIEIVPPIAPAPVDLAIPGSKSITNRALVLAALAQGTVTLEGALWSEDTEVMVACLKRLGFVVQVAAEVEEPANRRIQIQGRGGLIPRAGTLEQPLELFVGNAGTVARFLSALVCLGNGVYRLSGIPRMHERPQAALFAALRQLGYRVEATGERLPAVIYGTGPQPGRTEVSVDESSQFASALLLGAPVGGWEISVTGADSEELPYVEMTRKLIAGFPRSEGTMAVEPDASSASYFWAAGALLGHSVQIRHWPASGWQVDAEFPKFLPLPATISRERDLGDSIMTAAILAPFAAHPVRLTELGRLRVQECERVTALRTELSRCGARVLEIGDSLTVEPSSLHGATIHTYNDHRMAMCFATLGLKIPGVRIENPSCVKKTFPNFFQKLTAPAPEGWGTQVRDVASGRILTGAELLPA